MSAGVLAAVVLVLLLVAAGCLRVARWHTREATWWYRVQNVVNQHPETDTYYRPILVWAQTNPPSVFERIRGWEPPENRMTGITNRHRRPR